MGDARAVVTAAHDGNLEAVRRLVQRDRGLLEAIGQNWGFTPLTVAAWGGHVEVIRYLVGEGAQVDLQDGAGFSALGCACHNGHIEATRLLLSRGADPAITIDGGKTPLMTASEHGHTDVVAVLLAQGCGDVDRQRSLNGWTALHYACKEGHVGVAMALLGAGADPHVVEDEEGLTPLDMAVQKGGEECVAILQEWECRYLLNKARRLRDTAATLHEMQSLAASTAASSQAPMYVAAMLWSSRMGGLPEVEVQGERGGRKRGGLVGKALATEEAVVRHVVEGMRGELVKELMEMVDG